MCKIQLHDRLPHNVAVCLRESILIGIGVHLRVGRISLIRGRGLGEIVMRFQTPVVHEPRLVQELNETHLLKYQEHNLITDLHNTRSHCKRVLPCLSQLTIFQCHLARSSFRSCRAHPAPLERCGVATGSRIAIVSTQPELAMRESQCTRTSRHFWNQHVI
jgi:hypothetical protein